MTAMNEPWLDNKAWRGNRVSSGEKYGHWVIGGFALFWNLLTLPLYWQLDEIMARVPGEPQVLLAFLFPAVGVGLLWFSAVLFRRWRKFGPTPLVLDPFPGALGGHVGGWVETRIPFDREHRYAVTLSCLKSAVTGSGKDRKRSESVKWQTDGLCHTERGGSGTLLRFRFDVPAGLPATDMHKSGSYFLWRATITAELDGPDFDRSFEIPVFPTAERSGIDEGTEDHAATQDLAMEGVESVAEITAIPGGVEAWYPPWQRPAQGIFAALAGLFFGGAGVAVGFADDGGIMIPFIFTLVGGLILLYGLWYLGKALMVAVTAQELRCRRYLFGYPLFTRKLHRADLVGLEIHEGATLSSGNRTTVFYQLCALGRDGQTLPLGERLTSRAEAELLKETFETYLSV